MVTEPRQITSIDQLAVGDCVEVCLGGKVLPFATEPTAMVYEGEVERKGTFLTRNDVNGSLISFRVDRDNIEIHKGRVHLRFCDLKTDVYSQGSNTYNQKITLLQ